MALNVYQMVTDRIVEEMEKGIIPWQKPWTGMPCTTTEDGGAINYVSRRPYSLLNQFLLGKPGEWLSWKQIQDLKGKVKKGAHGSFVVFYTVSHYVKKDEQGNPILDENGKEQLITWPILKYYNVFHLDDVEGIESKLEKVEGGEKVEAQPTEEGLIESAEKVIADYLARETALKFINGTPSDKAYYSPSRDLVQVPMLAQYEEPAEYYSTTFHEFTHSTMKKSRCDREEENRGAFFGNGDYSREELVAEIGAAMLCNQTGIDCGKAFKNSIAYLQSWIKALKNDNKMIVWAAARAEKAARFILNDIAEA